ncbi:HK97 family phage prohead protease [Acetobacter okinawensis]|uniref:HK97 family phage prohead protease n=1 Tax=Acetobacter okinawensis TaxID=1076594 RepID=UPI0011777B97|nr:HK97 family phage prohead protease [Acetobacter okinawensis]
MIDGLEVCAVPFECKAAAGTDAESGHVEGYGAVFGNTDSHGDVILPGAFTQSIAERKAQGRVLPMHVMHGFFGGDGVPAGVWNVVSEDSKGLHVKGKISGTNTDAGRLLYERVKDGALGGLSIGFSIPKDGSVKMADPKGPRRQIKQANLHEVSLVDDPSNALARVTDLKRRMGGEFKSTIQTTVAMQALEAALGIYQKSLQGNDAPTAEERQQLLTHLQDAYEALTGTRMPDGLKMAMQSNATKSDFSKAMEQAMATMTKGMSDAPVNGDPDHDFLSMMIPHHQGAVAMAQAEIQHGKTPQVLDLARGIISTQTAQISAMQDMLSGKKSLPPLHSEMKSALAALSAAVTGTQTLSGAEQAVQSGLLPAGLAGFRLV